MVQLYSKLKRSYRSLRRFQCSGYTTRKCTNSLIYMV